MKRKISKKATPYETAFEEFLRNKHVLYIATNEGKRPIYEGKRIKNFDFLIFSFKNKYIVDVKGRRFADRPWENWIHFPDIDGLKNWSMFLPDFKPLLVYPYVVDSKSKSKFNDLFSYKGTEFGIVGITLEDYYLNLKRRGREKDEGIGGVYVSGTIFQKIVKPITFFIPELRDVPKGKI